MLEGVRYRAAWERAHRDRLEPQLSKEHAAGNTESAQRAVDAASRLEPETSGCDSAIGRRGARPGLQDAYELCEVDVDELGVGNVLEDDARVDGIERCVAEQPEMRLHVHLEAAVRTVAVDRAGLFDHPRGDVDSDCLVEPLGQRPRQTAGAAAEVECVATRVRQSKAGRTLEHGVDLGTPAREERVPLPILEPLVGVGEDRPVEILGGEVIPVAPETVESCRQSFSAMT